MSEKTRTELEADVVAAAKEWYLQITRLATDGGEPYKLSNAQLQLRDAVEALQNSE